MDKDQKIIQQGIWVLPIVVFVIVRWIVGFEGLYGQDAYEYLRYTVALRHALHEGTTAGAFFWPVNYPLLAMLIDEVIRHPSFTLQFLSCIAFIALCILLVKCVRLLYPNRHFHGYFVIASILLSPIFVRASTLIMSDMLAISFLFGGIYYFLKHQISQNSRNVLICTFAFSLAVFTRYGFAILVLPFAISLTQDIFTKSQYRSLLLVAVGFALGALPNILLKSNSKWGFTEHPFLTNWDPLNIFRSSYQSASGILDYTFPNLMHVFSWLVHPGFCWLLFLFLAFTPLITRPLINRIVLAATFLYLIFLAGSPEQNTRYLMPILPLVILICYPGFENLILRLTRRKLLHGAITIFLLIQGLLIFRAYRSPLHLHRTEQNIRHVLQQMAPNAIYSFGMNQALQGLGTHHEIISLWNQEHKTYISGSLVLFNPQKFGEQWRYDTPMKNWDRLQQYYLLDTVQVLDDGWILLRVP
ncbi:MAG: hypothetical protein OEQ53_00390 [Saprospiraceae bacterium]|nr:hypothetical protein [Saprospiraceae bacterium]